VRETDLRLNMLAMLLCPIPQWCERSTKNFIPWSKNRNFIFYAITIILRFYGIVWRALFFFF